MTIPFNIPSIAKDDVYFCSYETDRSPAFYTHDFGDSKTNIKKIADSGSLFPIKGHHYAIVHTHLSYSEITSKSWIFGNKETLFELISRVSWDINYYKSVLRSFSHLNLEDICGAGTKKVAIITKELAEDKALLLFLEKQYLSHSH